MLYFPVHITSDDYESIHRQVLFPVTDRTVIIVTAAIYCGITRYLQSDYF